MMRFLFKQPKPKQFEFRPRFYNPTKEYIESRKQIVRQQMSEESAYGSESALRSRIDEQWRSRKRQGYRANRNVLIIAAILFALAYLLLF